MSNPRDARLRLPALAAAALMACLATPARAQDYPPPLLPTPPQQATSPQQPTSARTDPLLHAGIATTAVGAGAVIGGALLRTRSGPEICGITGCVTTRDPDARVVSGGIIGAGVGASLVGVPALLMGLGRAPDVGQRRSEARMLTGVALTDLGATLVGAGVGLLSNDRGHWPATGTVAGIFLATGVATTAVGLPLWATGQARKRPSAPAPLPYPHPTSYPYPLAPYSLQTPAPPPPGVEYYPPGERPGEGMRTAGIALTLSGVGLIAAGGLAMALVDTRGDFGGFALLPGIVMFGTGNLLSSVGIPLWIVGQNKMSGSKSSREPPAEWALRAGGNGLWLEGRY